MVQAARRLRSAFGGTQPAALSTILIVDDDPGTRFVLRLILERASYRIVEAAHGGEALDLIGAADPAPDIVMTDLMMPVMNGFELVRRLRLERRTAEIPIVIVSSNPDAAQDLHASGLVCAVVGKPFDATELVERLRAVASNGLTGVARGRRS
jgi:CheY-like chemotaxis protein